MEKKMVFVKKMTFFLYNMLKRHDFSQKNGFFSCIKRPGPGLGVLIFFEANHCEAGVAKCC